MVAHALSSSGARIAAIALVSLCIALTAGIVLASGGFVPEGTPVLNSPGPAVAGAPAPDAAARPAGANTWTQVSNGMEGGYVRDFAISPGFNADHTLFAYLRGKLFKSVDGGGSWFAMSAPSSTYLAISPAYLADQTLFAYNGGLWKSTNGGSSWAPMTSTLPADVRSLALSPAYASDQTLFAHVGGRGVFRSTDGGATWTNVAAELPDAFEGPIAFSPAYASDRTVFAGTNRYDDPNILKSTDGGTTWTPLATGFGGGINGIALSPAYASDRTIFASANGALITSSDGGGSWRRIWTNSSADGLAISPSYAADRTLLVWGWDGVLKSTDGGLSWVSVMSGLPRRVLKVALSPSFSADATVFASTEGSGIFKSTNGGISYAAANGGVRKIAVNALAPSPFYAVDQTLFAATEGGVFKSTNGGGWWRMTGSLFDPDYAGGLQVSDIAVSPAFASDRTVIATAWCMATYISTDTGESWQNTGGCWGGGAAPIAISPSFASDRTAFYGTAAGISWSTDGGMSWSQLYFYSETNWTNHMAISPAFGSDRTVFAASAFRGVIKSIDGGQTWTNANGGLPTAYWGDGYNVAALAISPAYASDHTLFTSAFGTAEETGLYTSTNGGASWSKLAGIAPLTLAFSPYYAVDRTIYAATYGGGVFRSTDGGVSWASISDGLGSVEMIELAVVNTIPPTILGGSAEDGVWQYTVVATPSPTATPTATRTATRTQTATTTPSLTATPTATATATSTRTPADTATATLTRTQTPSATPTPSATATPTPTRVRIFLPIIMQALTPACDRYGFNDNYIHAWGPLISGREYEAYLCVGDSSDWYYIEATAAGPATVDLIVPFTVDYDVELYDTQGNLVAESKQYGQGMNEHIQTTVPAPGRYNLRVYPYAGRDEIRPYRLTVNFPHAENPPDR